MTVRMVHPESRRPTPTLLATGILATAFVVMAPMAAAQNLLNNPGFEGGMAGWGTSVGTAVYSADGTVKQSGAFSAHGVEVDGGSLGRLYQELTGQLVVGQRYRVSGWLKTEGTDGCGAFFGLDWVNDDGWSVAGGSGILLGYVNGTTDWTYFESPFVELQPAPPGATKLWFLHDFCAGVGTAWLDDVTLEPEEPEGWVSFQGHRYQLTDSRLTWPEAEAAARAAGGHLVSINSAEEQQFLTETFLVDDLDAETVWIGATDSGSEGDWQWSSGDAFVYSNWHPDEPNDSLEGEDYGCMNWWRDFTNGAETKGDWNDCSSAGTPVVPVVLGPFFGIIEVSGRQMASTGEDGTSLVRIDLDTGKTTYVGPFGVGGTWATAFTPDGTLWTLLNWGESLASVNRETGAASVVGPTLVKDTVIALESDCAGNLYALGWSGDLYLTNKGTGQLELIGNSGYFSTMDLAFDRSGKLWAVNGGPELWSIDPVTGAGTFETLFDVEGVMGFGVDSDDNFFLTDWVFAPNLYSLDPVSGDTAVIGPVASIFPHGGDVFEACSFPPTFLEATGVCPGTVTFQVTDATPGATLAIVRGTGEGKVTVPFGPCPGIQLGLSGPELVTTVVADPDGSFLVAPTLGGSTCGVHLQVMDTASCTTTNVVRVPD